MSKNKPDAIKPSAAAEDLMTLCLRINQMP
jgi:hypothetical protein